MQNSFPLQVESPKRKNTLLLILTIVMIVALYFQSFHNYSSYIVLPILLLWMPFVFSSFYSFSRKEQVFVIVSILFLLLFIIYYLLGYSELKVLNVIRSITWLLAGVISISVMNLFTVRELNRFYMVYTIVIVLLFVLFSIKGHSLIEIEEEEEASSIASTWQSSMIMLISGISLIFLLHVKKFLPRTFALVVFLLSLYINVFVFQRGTNVIFVFVEIALILFFGLRNKFLIGVLAVFTLGMAIYIHISDFMFLFFDWLAKISPSQRLADRFISISYAMQFESIEAGGGSFAARNDLMELSWHTFTSNFSNFLFGVGEHRSNYSIIGNHSFILDTLASYGIIGGLLMLVYFIKQYQLLLLNVNKQTDWSLYMQSAVVFLMYILRSFYGNVANANVIFLIMFFFPMTLRVIKNYKLNLKFTI